MGKLFCWPLTSVSFTEQLTTYYLRSGSKGSRISDLIILEDWELTDLIVSIIYTSEITLFLKRDPKHLNKSLSAGPWLLQGRLGKIALIWRLKNAVTRTLTNRFSDVTHPFQEPNEPDRLLQRSQIQREARDVLLLQYDKTQLRQWARATTWMLACYLSDPP